MSKKVVTDNSIFIHLLFGSLLFIAATAFTVLNIANIALLKVSYTVAAGLLSIGAITLLYTAVKNDKARMSRA